MDVTCLLVVCHLRIVLALLPSANARIARVDIDPAQVHRQPDFMWMYATAESVATGQLCRSRVLVHTGLGVCRVSRLSATRFSACASPCALASLQ
eukprot:4677965-Pleurochrysis_carterae.AAC.3